MALLSFLLSLAAGLLMFLGFLATVIPGLGAVLSFAAPALALAGIVLGSMAISRARREGRSRDFAVVAVLLNVLAFFPALMVAMTCGVCNAMVASGPIQMQRSMHVQMGFPAGDAGLEAEPSRLDPPPIAPVEPAPEPPAQTVPPPPLPPGPSEEPADSKKL